jgi:hypothetical protein
MHLLQNRQYVTEGIDTEGCNFNGKHYKRDEHTELQERLIALRYLYCDYQCNMAFRRATIDLYLQ